MKSWRLNPSIKVGRKHGRFVFTTSIKRPVRAFHVVVVQWGQRNVQKCLLHVQSCFSLIKTTFFAVLVALNVIVAYFESSLILTVDGKCVRGAGQLGPMMRRRRKTLSILRYRKCCASTSKLFSLLSFNTKWTYRYIFFVFVRKDWLYEVPTQHHLWPD